jgi:hypothetical protein
VIVYQPLIDKMYKSQPTLILNLFEGTIDVAIFLLRKKRTVSFFGKASQSVFSDVKRVIVLVCR